MNIIFLIPAIVCGLGVLGSLAAGILTMGGEGENRARRSNWLMRYRVVLQGLTVLFLALAVLTA